MCAKNFVDNCGSSWCSLLQYYINLKKGKEKNERKYCSMFRDSFTLLNCTFCSFHLINSDGLSQLLCKIPGLDALGVDSGE